MVDHDGLAKGFFAVAGFGLGGAGFEEGFKGCESDLLADFGEVRYVDHALVVGELELIFEEVDAVLGEYDLHAGRVEIELFMESGSYAARSPDSRG